MYLNRTNSHSSDKQIMMFSALLLFAQTQLCFAVKTWPAVEKGPDASPTIELSLDSSVSPGNMNFLESGTYAGISQLKESFSKAVELGKREILKTATTFKHRGQAFLSFDEPSIRVKVPESGKATTNIADFGGRLAASDKQFFAEEAAYLQSFAREIASTFSESVAHYASGQSSFLQQKGKLDSKSESDGLNVRLASASFPTGSSSIQALVSRGNLRSRLIRAEALELQLNLANSLNEFMREQLRAM